LAAGYGTPTRTTARHFSSEKSKPSDIFPLARANKRAPLFLLAYCR